MATLGKTFDFPVFSRRWGHPDNYRLTLTTSGWDFQFMNRPGAGPTPCGTDANPALRGNLEHDSIAYPEDVFFGISYLHDHQLEISDSDMQDALKQLADWISITEQSTPDQGALQGIL